MTASRSEKLAQFEEFFAINYRFTINALVIESSKLPSYNEFLTQMPTPFKLASDVNTLEQSALRPLQAVAGVAQQLMDYLSYQAEKVDLLLGYILSQQDQASARYQAEQFGGSGILFSTNIAAPFKAGDFLELKLFFNDDNFAIYCIGEIIDATLSGQQQTFKVIFHHIREADQEALVRLSLHQQSKQLQALAQQRKQANKNK
ncbi:PilZ domain-containing protein [Colwellia chukchiensis]|uniref:PilZ domain-containing protein n=1 Tax=Colwellia chukchiensis TaxID=641665 RepID=A0A1H7GXQ8_9GAMM|nr:PilZ domain-containing protein [Colwellia chukchiensis]SEK42804.1 PilZ domain-containing protein [Colwellia chukchiensis]